MENPNEKQVTDLVLMSKAVIFDQASLDKAAEALVAGKGLIRKIKDYFAPLKTAAHGAWKRICDQESEELAKLTPAVTVLERNIADYRQAEERKRMAAEAERRRQEGERKRLEEETLKKAEAAPPEEQDRILAEAAAEESKLEPVAVVPPKPVNEGLVYRDNWTYEVVDEAAIPREYCVPDWPRIGRLAKAEKDKLQIPGVRPVNRPVMASRSAGTR